MKAILVQNAEHDEQRKTTDHNQTIGAHHQHRTGRTQAPLWHEDDFIGARTNLYTILEGDYSNSSPQRDEFLGYKGGVRLSEFIDPMSAGIFEIFPSKIEQIRHPSNYRTMSRPHTTDG